jgi:hypothetical protein
VVKATVTPCRDASLIAAMLEGPEIQRLIVDLEAAR